MPVVCSLASHTCGWCQLYWMDQSRYLSEWHACRCCCAPYQAMFRCFAYACMFLNNMNCYSSCGCSRKVAKTQWSLLTQTRPDYFLRVAPSTVVVLIGCKVFASTASSIGMLYARLTNCKGRPGDRNFAQPPSWEHYSNTTAWSPYRARRA